MENNKEFFQLVYDGPSLENHEMDVKDLAPALLAASDLLEEANALIYSNRTQIQVNIKGSFKTGSFKIDFSLFQNMTDQLVNLFNTREVVSVGLILSLLGLSAKDGVAGLIQVLQWQKNRKIKKITKIGDNKVTLEIDDESIETEEKVIDLLKNVKIRKAIDTLINKPLSREGVDKFFVKHAASVIEVDEKDKDFFKVPEEGDELIEDKVSEKNLQAVSISFAEGNKWRFTDGNVTFYANVNDADFINRVQDNKEIFAKDDILRVSLREKQWITDSGIKTEYEIEKIISHRPSAKQIKLPLESVDE